MHATAAADTARASWAWHNRQIRFRASRRFIPNCDSLQQLRGFCGLAIDAKNSRNLPGTARFLSRGETAEPKMTDIDRLQTLASVCVKAAHNVEDTEVAAMLLETAQRFLERTNPQLALPRTDIQELNRRQLYAGFQH